LEILTQHSALTEKASKEFGVAELSSLPAREIYGTFCHVALHANGGEETELGGEEGEAGRVSPALPMDFGSVLAAIEDAALKNLLVELDERASAKASHALEDGFSQLAAVCRAIRDRQQQTERRAQLAALQDGRTDQAQQLSAFNQLLAAKRHKLVISKPTEG
jgi:hypothetical protein